MRNFVIAAILCLLCVCFIGCAPSEGTTNEQIEQEIARLAAYMEAANNSGLSATAQLHVSNDVGFYAKQEFGLRQPVTAMISLQANAAAGRPPSNVPPSN